MLSSDVLSKSWGKAMGTDRKQFDMFFDRMLDGFAYHKIVVDKSGKPIDYIFLEVNEPFERMTGIKRERILGKKVTDVLHGIEKDPADWIGVYGRVALTGEPVQFENHAGPLGKWFKISAYCPKKGHFVALFEDITERKKAEEALKENENKFRAIADFTYDWEYWIAPNGHLIYVSPSCKRITGYDAKEFIKDPKLLTRIVHHEDKSVVGSHFDLISSEELHAVDFRILTKDGETRWISHSCQAVFDNNGKWAGRRASNRDITRRKKTEQELSISLEESQRRESEISALLKASRTVLLNKKFPDSAQAIFNSCKELLGATAGYVALLSDNGKENIVLFLDSGGLPCSVDPSLPMPIRGLRAEAYNSGKVAIENDFPRSEWQKFSPRGHMLLENVLFAPLTIEQRTVGVIGLANKLGGFTERDSEMASAFGELASIALVNSKMLEMLEENEKELKMHSEHLETLVKERTNQLKDSERLAAIGATAGMVGHDIRNPLQAIIGDIYLAKTELTAIPESDEKKNVQESLQEIEKNVDYINKIVADLQDFARPLNPREEETDLKCVIDDLLAKNGLPENVKVSVKVDTGKVVADSTFISRIMYNLVNNAVQAMPKGGKLTIRVNKEGNDVVIMVKDTGVGIPQAVKSKLFTPMFTTKSKGQGFGLPVVKRMTEALSGTVSFESEEGKGTTFEVHLPAQKVKP